MARQALDGLKVIEIGNIVAGPWAGSMLADFGASVIKIEDTGSGDLMRGMGRIKDMWYAVEGRNKQNVTLNLKTPEGKEILWKLIEGADVLIENFRTGVFARLGFSWEEMHERNPRLIYSAASGYGRSGPYAPRPGFDRMGLAYGGFLEVCGYPDSAPVKPGISVADFWTAMFSCMAIMFAVYDRDVNGSGEGQMIDCALSESVLRLQESIIAEYNYDGTVRHRIGNGTTVTVPSGHFLCRDGKYIALSIAGDKLWKAVMTKIGREDMIDTPEYATQVDRAAHRDEINAQFGKWALDHTLKEALEILGEDIPACPIYDVSDIMKDPQFAARQDFITIDTPFDFGRITMQGVVPKMSGTPGEVRWSGQKLGAFNEKIYGEMLGYTAQQLARFKEQGII